MSRLLTIGEAAEVLGVSVPALRRWDTEGRLQPDERTAGGQRRYDLGKPRLEESRAKVPTLRRWEKRRPVTRTTCPVGQNNACTTLSCRIHTSY
jgi:excisionase family DNA binding protein